MTICDRLVHALEDARYLHIQLERLKLHYQSLASDELTLAEREERMESLDVRLSILRREQNALKAGIHTLLGEILNY